jgi:Sel1 repeat
MCRKDPSKALGMKILLASVLVAIALASHAQVGHKIELYPWGIFPPVPPPPTPEQLEQQRKDNAASMRLWWLPPDPWRLDAAGDVVQARGTNWAQCRGRIMQVADRGVLISGNFGPAFEVPNFDCPGQTIIYFIAHFPVPMAQAEDLPTNIVAEITGTLTYTNSSGSTVTIRKVDYGIPVSQPVSPPASAAQLTAAKKKDAEARARALAWNTEQAAKGDAYAQLRMGQRYLTGDGVAKDPAKAREFFQLSAAQGNATAAAELAKLDAK